MQSKKEKAITGIAVLNLSGEVSQVFNARPYRTREQRIAARAQARVVNGTWVSPAPFSLHGVAGEYVWNGNGVAVRVK